jgi:rare lipoprotein A
MKAGFNRQGRHENHLVLHSLASFAFFAVIAFLLAGCGSTPKRGGFYQDDGPGGPPPVNLDKLADAEPKVEPLNRAAGFPYSVFGQRYVPNQSLQPYRKRGIATWYGRKFHGRRTSSGERYDMYTMTAAHTILAIPSYARVTNLKTGHSIIVRINDRGPFHSGRIIDLSFAAAYKLGFAGSGSAMVEVEAIMPADMPRLASRKPDSRPIEVARSKTVPEVPATAPEAKPPAIPISAEANGIYLQLGVFSVRENADDLRVRIYQQLNWLNQAIEILPENGLFRLRLGPYRDRTEAKAIADRIRESLELKPIVVVR